MALNTHELRNLYRKRSTHYGLTANLYYLIGFREWRYRQKAVNALKLMEGDTVVELGCGTGLNFPLLQKKIGPEGRIIGVDLTDRMLEMAERRIHRMGWQNVELVQAEAGTYAFPEGTAAVLSTFALTLMPAYDRIVWNSRQALNDGGRLAVLDLRKPENAPPWLIRLMVRLTSPFGVSLDLAGRHPWESVDRHFPFQHYEEYFLGFVFLSVGEAG